MFSSMLFFFQETVFQQVHHMARASDLHSRFLQQRSRQNVLAILLHHEAEGLQTIQTQIASLHGTMTALSQRLSREEECLRKLAAFEKERGLGKVGAGDIVVRTAMAIVSGKGEKL